MNKVLADKKAILIFMAPAVLFFVAIILIPIFMSVYYSLTEWNGMGDKIYVGFSNYTKLFTFKDALFLKAVKNSLILAMLSLVIQLPAGMFLAMVLAKGVKGEPFFITVFFIPVIISTVAIGQLWIKIYNPGYGLLNTFLNALNLSKLSHIRIILPQIKPMLKTAVSFSVIGSLKVYDLIYVLTNGGPTHSTEVPSTLMVWTIFKRNDYGFGSAMAIFIIIECFFAMYLVRKCFEERE